MTTVQQVIQDRAALQAQLYAEMKAEGAARYDAQQESAKARGEGSDTMAGRMTLPLMLPQVAEVIVETIASYQGRLGKTPRFVSILKTMDANTLAALTIKHGWDAVGKRTKLGKALVGLGQAVEAMKMADDLLKADQEAAESQDADAFKGWGKTIKRVSKSNDTARSRARGLRGAAKAKGVEVEEWDPSLRVHVAEPLFNALMTTGLFVREDDLEDSNTHSYLSLTDLGRELVKEVDDTYRHLSPMMFPMVTKPEPWMGFNKGCFNDKALCRSLSLVRTSDKEHKALVEEAIADGAMKDLMTALTAISQVEFEINSPVAELVEWVGKWEANLDPHLGRTTLGVKKFPRLTMVEERGLPEDFLEMSTRDKARAIRDMKRTRRVNKGVDANGVVFANDLGTMKRLMSYGGFFMPHNMDFRGRVYPATGFNHQRADHIKGTIRFAQGKRVGVNGWKWLRAALANAGDFGKVSKKPWAARIDWTEANRAELVSIARDPQGNAMEWLQMTPEERKADTKLRWFKADKPFTFYALCLEVAAAWEMGNPEDFVSHMPIAFDGSNSGVQHYTAALRAEEGALVNLTPAGEAADLYATVAKDVLQKALQLIDADGATIQGDPRELIAEYAEAVREWDREEKARKEQEKKANGGKAVRRKKGEPVPECPFVKLRDMCAAMLWVRNNLGRSHVKRNVMTFGYSSGVFGFKEQIVEDHMDELELKRIAGEIPVHPFGDDAGEAAAGWLAKQVWDSVTRILKKTHEGMEFFQACAGALAHEGKPMVWRTPLGFPVINKYQEWEMKEVELFLYDRSVPVYEKADKDKVAADGTVLKRFRTLVNDKPTGVIKKAKQKSSIAPNIIHSMDSTHLLMVVLKALKADITNFMLIHDSFATHAADCGDMDRDDGGFFWIIRHAFVDLYQGFDLFRSIKDSVFTSLSEEGRAEFTGVLPGTGNLELSGVAESAFAFA